MNSKTILVLIAACALLSACGNKGPLVQAEAPKTVAQPLTVSGDVPVEIAPEPVPVAPTATPLPISELDPVDADAPIAPVDPEAVPEAPVEEDPLPEPPAEPAADDTDG